MHKYKTFKIVKNGEFSVHIMDIMIFIRLALALPGATPKQGINEKTSRPLNAGHSSRRNVSWKPNKTSAL